MELTIAKIVSEGFRLLESNGKGNFSPMRLPYAYDSLSEFIDEETMKVHYNGHYKGYVKKLNELLKERDAKIDYSNGVESLMVKTNGLGKKIRNQAGGAYNHEIFWSVMTPDKDKRVYGGKIKELIDSQFGSLDEFKEKFLNEAKGKFGSGWCWLLLKPSGKLKIITTSNQDNPKMNIYLTKDKNDEGVISYRPMPGKILLGLDLWEHSYYLKYKNKREDYIKNFWKVLNWEYVNEKVS
jgi:Fe-Mn family superoxide dismutase